MADAPHGAAAPILPAALATSPQTQTSTPAGSSLEDRMICELQPLLVGLAMLTNCVRVLEALQDAASFSPELDDAISRACPTWQDPLCHGGDASAQAVVCELARYAADIGAELVAVAMSGGAA